MEAGRRKRLENILFVAAVLALLATMGGMALWYWRGEVVAKLDFDGPGRRSVRAEFVAGEVRVSMPTLTLTGHRGHTPSELVIRALQDGSVVATSSCDPDSGDNPTVTSSRSFGNERSYTTSVLPDCAFQLPRAGLTELEVTLNLPGARALELEFKQ